MLDRLAHLWAGLRRVERLRAVALEAGDAALVARYEELIVRYERAIAAAESAGQ